MKVHYHRVSTLSQTDARLSVSDKEIYDRKIFDKVSGKVKFADRPQAKELIKLIESGRVEVLTCASIDRLGRNTADVINTCQWMEEHGVTLKITNIGMASKTDDGKANPIFKLITGVMASLSEMEREAIAERCISGMIAARASNNVQWGRPLRSFESEKKFLGKAKNQKIIELLNRERTIREISKIVGCSSATVIKVKKVAGNHKLLEVA